MEQRLKEDVLAESQLCNGTYFKIEQRIISRS
jgi:hypothetical protein